MTFTVIKPSLFSGVRKTNKIKVTAAESNDLMQYVRRPTNGVSIKKDTYGCIMYNGSVLNTSAPGNQSSYDYNLLIQSFSMNRQEKSQVIETFGDHYVYMFGERAPTATISAYLLDTETFEWFQQFDINYQNAYRGTQLALSKNPINIVTSELNLVGYIDSVQYSQSATQDPYMVSVNIVMILERIEHLSDITIPKIPKTESSKYEILTKLSNQIEVGNTLNTKFKSIFEEVAYLSQLEANQGYIPTDLENGLNEIVKEYRSTQPKNYFEAYQGEYIYGNFLGLGGKTFDEASDLADVATALQENKDILKLYESENEYAVARFKQLSDQLKNVSNIENQVSENVGVYIDGVIPDQNLVDIISESLGGLFTDDDGGLSASAKLRVKQSTSMATSLAVYGLKNAASKLTTYIDAAEDAVTGVRTAITQGIDSALGGTPPEDVSEPSVGDFV
jgi:hypothetical protein